jgi:hypothetical protein
MTTKKVKLPKNDATPSTHTAPPADSANTAPPKSVSKTQDPPAAPAKQPQKKDKKHEVIPAEERELLARALNIRTIGDHTIPVALHPSRYEDYDLSVNKFDGKSFLRYSTKAGETKFFMIARIGFSNCENYGNEGAINPNTNTDMGPKDLALSQFNFTVERAHEHDWVSETTVPNAESRKALADMSAKNFAHVSAAINDIKERGWEDKTMFVAAKNACLSKFEKQYSEEWAPYADADETPEKQAMREKLSKRVFMSQFGTPLGKYHPKKRGEQERDKTKTIVTMTFKRGAFKMLTPKSSDETALKEEAKKRLAAKPELKLEVEHIAGQKELKRPSPMAILSEPRGVRGTHYVYKPLFIVDGRTGNEIFYESEKSGDKPLDPNRSPLDIIESVRFGKHRRLKSGSLVGFCYKLEPYDGGEHFGVRATFADERPGFPIKIYYDVQRTQQSYESEFQGSVITEDAYETITSGGVADTDGLEGDEPEDSEMHEDDSEYTKKRKEASVKQGKKKQKE